MKKGRNRMADTKAFGIGLSGWGETMYYTVIVPAGTDRDAVADALMAGKPVTAYRPRDWTPQMAYRCGLHGWTCGSGIAGPPDIRL